MTEAFVGCRICLIGVNDIRFEGILEFIDPQNSTVSLKDVECFGTDDRATGGNYVPPTTTIEPFMVFSGEEIKDLTIMKEDENVGQNSFVDNDNNNLDGQVNLNVEQNVDNILDDIPDAPTYNQNYPPAPGYPAINNNNDYNMNYNNNQNNQGNSRQNSNYNMNNYNQNNRRNNYNNNNYNNNNYNQNNNRRNNNYNNNNQGFANYNNNNYNNNRNSNYNRNNNPNYNNNYNNNQNNFNNNQNYNNRRNTNYNKHHDSHVGELSAAENAQLKNAVSMDFDFASQNRLFIKENHHKDNQEKYNKSSSFFDCISCEALNKIPKQQNFDPIENRKLKDQQRALDKETFGESNLPRGEGFAHRRRFPNAHNNQQRKFNN